MNLNSDNNDGCSVQDHIRILEHLIMLDRNLFKKEFNKTKYWVSPRAMELIESWFRQHYEQDIFDL